MKPPSSNLRGIFFMMAAMAVFIVNDSMLKMATTSLPPFETLFLRAVIAVLWGVPLLWLTGSTAKVMRLFDRWGLVRNGMEMLAVLGFILGLARVSIADITALGQLAPIIVVIGAALFLKTRVTRAQIVLSVLAFGGALMVAQPGTGSFSLFALFGLWNAVMIAVRDLGGRKIAADVPGAVVAFGAALVVLVATAIIGPLFEKWVMPGWSELGLIAGAALFLMAGHYSIFMAYRAGEPGVVAPFFYTSAVWALVSALMVFGTVPNTLALAGIAIIIVCGVLVVLADGRSRRRAAVKRVLPPAV